MSMSKTLFKKIKISKFLGLLLVASFLVPFFASEALAGGTGFFGSSNDRYGRFIVRPPLIQPPRDHYAGFGYDERRADGYDYYRNLDLEAKRLYENNMRSGEWNYYEQDRQAFRQEYINWKNDVEARARDYHYLNQDTRVRDQYFWNRDSYGGWRR
jgi:hypothetical protein